MNNGRALPLFIFNYSLFIECPAASGGAREASPTEQPSARRGCELKTRTFNFSLFTFHLLLAPRLAEPAGRSHRRRRPATLRVLSFAGCVRAQIENGNRLPPIIHCSLAAPAAQPVAAPGRRAALSAKPSERLRRLRSENTPWQSKTCGPQPPRAKARNSRCSCRPSLAAACPFGVSLHLSLLTFYFITFYFSCERACFCARLFVSLPYLKSA